MMHLAIVQPARCTKTAPDPYREVNVILFDSSDAYRIRLKYDQDSGNNAVGKTDV